MNDGTKGDDFTHMDSEHPKFDGNLKLESRLHTAPVLGEHHQKALNLDIDLIDDSFLHAPLTKSPNFQFTGSQPNSKCSFNKFGDWSLSPNASFIPRKKF